MSSVTVGFGWPLLYFTKSFIMLLWHPLCRVPRLWPVHATSAGIGIFSKTVGVQALCPGTTHICSVRPSAGSLPAPFNSSNWANGPAAGASNGGHRPIRSSLPTRGSSLRWSSSSQRNRATAVSWDLPGPPGDSAADEPLARRSISPPAQASWPGGLRDRSGYGRSSRHSVLPGAPRCDTLASAPVDMCAGPV